MIAKTLMTTDFHFPKQKAVYKGKVRDMYTLEEDILVMVVTDKLSAFDVVLPRGIPYKGQMLNQIATQMLRATEDIVPNWLVAVPDPNVAIGRACEPIKLEMVIRGYLSGHAAREYKAGKRLLCGEPLPEGMRENDKFPQPIITPATKAAKGAHDEDISKTEILERGIVAKAEYEVLERYTRALFQRGTAIAAQRGLILVDTKYEFGKTRDGEILLIDEIHTPDSSRYFYAEGYKERQAKGDPQKQLSKEFVRQWLISNGFQGLEGQTLPRLSDAYIQSVSERYIELYECITGQAFEKADSATIQERINTSIAAYLEAKP